MFFADNSLRLGEGPNNNQYFQATPKFRVFRQLNRNKPGVCKYGPGGDVERDATCGLKWRALTPKIDLDLVDMCGQPVN